ncbi:hypothetical protein PCANC_11567 [Puccinia coronata f. sp. avenae]|uniref:Uncharacterized protein n=1 Tax=Puccinia coronata f. sp. avenae TaxID=200324 RepID=A0A2N5T0D9_9BASI|nr:hypothetical protein PCANC_12811 [Puccinia coronata f. sp. avenae]PLW30701.1 hypothetical protein PCASD_20137 [Puccinia coronata f. sp. avenae]PLW46096.1 hypothetical protein PCANC_11567 [Puccinia coronata f. sp. avenae]
MRKREYLRTAATHHFILTWAGRLCRIGRRPDVNELLLTNPSTPKVPASDMAKANLKRLSDSNRGVLALLSKVLIGANAIHLLSILIFSSQKMVSRYGLYHLISSTLSYLSYSFLFNAGSPQKRNGTTQTPDDLSTGIHQYMVDYCYISAFVWVATALISKSFWMTYWIIPIYALYKAFQISRRLFFS